ncbi:MAG TPA: DUF4956 domain-containing protein [Blastocatellia bacterium]|jgi:uncharacterized membrane protein YhiD involved in acid resistance|nr:DUF4956 domain-containing protein [Blastocatellia bacterium]
MSNRGDRFDRYEGDDYYDMPEESDPRRRGDGRRSDDRRSDDRRSDDRYRHVRDSAQDAIRRANSRGQSRKKTDLSRLMKKRGLLIAALIGGIAVLALVTYLLVSRSADPSGQSPTATQTKQAPPVTTPAQPTPPPATDKANEGPLPWLTGSRPLSNSEPTDEGLLATVARTTLKLALAALLAAMLAFRPRKDLPVLQRNPYVAQTQILLAVVASALMMIVADNAARAFGIFAAASLVRFRTNIRDPKEITILLISLGIGLATGVGRVELAIILSLFVLVMLWVLEYYEPTQVFRAMELTVTTRKVDETDEILREIFERRNLTTEIRKVDREDEEDPLGKIVYYVNVNPSTSTDQLSEEIFGSDPDNIDSIQWDQKKSNSYIYR